MNGLARVALCGLFLTVCSSPLLADTLTISGNVSFDQRNLSFAPPFATGTNNTGIFAPFSGGTMYYYLGTVAYVDGVPQTELAFSIVNAQGDTLSYYDETNVATKSLDANGDLSVVMNDTGYYTINGGDHLAGTLQLAFTGTSADGSQTLVPFAGTGALAVPTVVSATPEPGSVFLLGTGFLGMAAFLRPRARLVR